MIIHLVLCLFVTTTLAPVSLEEMTLPRTDLDTPSRVSLRGTILKSDVSDDDWGNVRLTIKLRLTFTNESSEKVLLLKRDLEVVDRAIIVNRSVSDSADYLVRRASYPAIDQGKRWQSLQKEINKPSPPPIVRVLAPDETWSVEITDWFQISRTQSVNPSDKPWSVIRESAPIWLLVTFEWWPKNMEPGDDREELEFGKMLRHRWQKYGELQLGSITSEPIKLDLSMLQPKDKETIRTKRPK